MIKFPKNFHIFFSWIIYFKLKLKIKAITGINKILILGHVLKFLIKSKFCQTRLNKNEFLLDAKLDIKIKISKQLQIK